MSSPAIFSIRSRIAQAGKAKAQTAAEPVTSTRRGYAISLGPRKDMGKLLAKAVKKVIRGVAALTLRLRGNQKAGEAAEQPKLTAAMPQAAPAVLKAAPIQEALAAPVAVPSLPEPALPPPVAAPSLAEPALPPQETAKTAPPDAGTVACAKAPDISEPSAKPSKVDEVANNALDALKKASRTPRLSHANPNRFRGGNYRQTVGRAHATGEALLNIIRNPGSGEAARALALALGDIPARPLPEAVADWYPAEQNAEITEIWRALAGRHPKAAEEFSKFLDKLSGHPSAGAKTFRADIRGWLSHLAVSPDLLKQTFFSAEEASSSCDDRIGLALYEMRGHILADKIGRGLFDEDIGGFVLELRKEFRMKALQEFGAEKVEALVEGFKKGLGPDRLAQLGKNDFEIEAVLRGEFVDEIEIHLDLPLALRDRLQLDFGALDKRYMSKLKDADYAAAEALAKRRENAEFPVWFANSHHWNALLQRLQPEKHAAFMEQRAAVLEEVLQTLDASVDAEIAKMDKRELAKEQGNPRDRIAKRMTDELAANLAMPLTAEILAAKGFSAMLNPVW